MVVVIDDDRTQGMVLAETIQNRGVEAQNITRWDQLQKILMKKSISCLVIDYHLQDGWAGPELAKLLRSFGCSDIPIFFTSADNSDVVRRQCEAGGHPFVPKKWRWLLANLVVAKVLRHCGSEMRVAATTRLI